MNKDFKVGVGTTINELKLKKCMKCEPYETGFIEMCKDRSNCGYGKVISKQEQALIGKVVEALSEFLIAKNKNYGNSALKPIKIFSKVEPTNSICVRMDDKISRIVNSSELRKNDIVDLTGYLVLLCAQKGWDDFKELID